MMKNTIQISAAKNYFLGFATSGLFLIVGLYYFNSNKDTAETPQSFSEILKAEKAPLQEFNPNDLTEAEWIDLGFTERQVATILNYKSVVGGQFTSKEQIKKCYSVSAEKYAALEPYILLPENSARSFSSSKNYSNNYRQSLSPYPYKSYEAKGLKISGKFNPDTYRVEDFVKLGFTEKQSQSIIKYRNYLGGSFISKEKFRECYMISEENYRKLAPYLLLPESSQNNPVEVKSFATTKTASEKAAVSYQPFDPNTTDLQGWKDLGFSEKQAQVIINYRDRNLKGSFKSLEDISRCFVISAEKFESLKPFIILNEVNDKVKNTDHTSNNNNSLKSETSKNQNEESVKTDFRKINLNEITFKQLLEYGFDEKSAASYIGFRNKLGGFVNTTQIVETYNIDKDLAQKLITTAPLLVNNVAKYSLIDAPESWLKNHPYFKYYADKIIYYRITYSDEKKFFRTMKIKPEAEQKMRLYLK